MSFEENYNSSSSWMRSKVNRSTTAISSGFLKTHRKTISSPTESPCKESIPTEVRANSPICNTINFNSLHRRYNNTMLDSIPIENESSDNLPLEKKYLNNINRLNQEIQIMSNQLKLSNETIASLTNKINESNHQHAIHIQELHERHEQKISKIKSDIDKFFNQVNSKPSAFSIERLIMEKNFEIEEQQKKYTQHISKLTFNYEKKIKSKETEHSEKISLLKQQFLVVVQEIKEKFLTEIESLHKKYKVEMDQIKQAMRLIAGKDGGSDDEISTAIEIDHEKNHKPQDSLSDLQIIEEMSSQQNMFIKPFNESIDAGSDLDLSLKNLISQISLDNEISLTDILTE
jgi:hypothetical protein